jgi:tetratricopeptide (TPR) repeat protein
VIRIVRIIATVAVVVAALWGLDRYCLRPYRCNRVKLDAQRAVSRAFEVGYKPSDIANTMRAHQRALQACFDCTPTDVSLHMDMAALYRYIGRNEDAEQTYKEALRYDERPEIYLNLGQTQMALHKEKEAIASFARAAVFNPYNLQHLDLGVRQQVEAEISRDYPWIGTIFPAQRSW